MLSAYIETRYLDSERTLKVKELKSDLLGHCSKPFKVERNGIAEKVAAEDIPELIIVAINLVYRSEEISSYKDLFSQENAQEILVAKAVTGDDSLIWEKLIPHMGTHHPKSRNDKASSEPVIALNLSSPPAGLVTSGNLGKYRPFSGSGNAVYVAHYQWLAFTYEDSAGTLSVIERAACEDKPLGDALKALGIDPKSWVAFCQAVKDQLTLPKVKVDPPDRQLKQIFVPDPTQNGEGYLVITPLTATRVVSAFKQQRDELKQQQASLDFDTIKIGGTKPQNAGSLINELKGLHQLTMPIPRFSLQEQQRRLWWLQHKGRLFKPMAKPQAQELQNWLEQDWKLSHGNRQDHLQQLENRLNEWLFPELEAQECFFAWLSARDTLETVMAQETLQAAALPNWLLTLIGLSESPENDHRIRQSWEKAAYGGLTAHMKQPLDDKVNKLIRDALESIFTRYYAKEEADE